MATDAGTIVEFSSLRERLEEKGCTLDIEDYKGKPSFLVSHDKAPASYWFWDLYSIQSFLNGIEFIESLEHGSEGRKEEEKAK